MESWLDSENERRSFHFFLTHAGIKLGGYFPTPFWSREVLQAAIHYPAIRHLVVALGSAYEQFEARQMDQKSMQFALQQSNQSIRHLTHASSANLVKQSIETSSALITASLLFTVLSSIQGHMGEAMDHILSGLRMLQNLEQDQINLDDCSSISSGSSRGSPPASSYPVSLARLRSLLTSLYLQCRVMLSDADLKSWHKDPLVTEIEFPTSFASLIDAQDHVEALFGNQLTFFQDTASRYPLSDEESIEVLARQDTLLYALDCSRTALDAFVARQPLDCDPADESAIKVLRLYHLYLGIRLGVGILRDDAREFAFDEFETHFEDMLAYCKDLLGDGEPLQPTCSSGLGVVIPLHMIGHRCRNPLIRQEAVDLLLVASRREGLWDSTIIGRIAATTSRLEQDEEMMKQWRVREVKTQFMSDRRARLVFITGDSASNQRRYYREIDW